MRVLIIEDNPGDVRLIREMLAEDGTASWETESAGTLAEGLRRLAEDGFDLALLDLGLPDSLGMDTLRRYVARAGGVPVVVMTGMEDELLGLEAVRVGAQDYLVKGKADAEVLARSLRYAGERASLALRLRESEELHRTLAETSPDAIVLSDLEGRITFFSERGLELFGYAGAEEVLGRLATDFFHPGDHDKARRDLELIRRSEGIFRHEYTMVRKDGSAFTGELSSSLVRDGRGRPRAIVSIARDVTEQRRAQERLEKLNRLFLGLGADIIENVEAILKVGLELLGGREMHYSRFQKGRLASIIAEAGSCRFSVTGDLDAHLCAPVIRGGGEEAFIVPDIGELPGAEKYEEAARIGRGSFLGYPVKLGKQVIGCLSLYAEAGREYGEDELETAGTLARIISIEEERLAREERLKEFIDVASHELRHPLAVMKGYALLLREKEAEVDEETRREALEAISRGVDRLNLLVLELLDTSRIERGGFVLDRREVPITELLEEPLARIAERDPERNVKLEVSMEVERVRVDPAKVRLMVSALLENACKFSPPGSEVELRAEAADGGVMISVLDRGPGVPEEERERIFERFYQVGESRHHSVPGMGLGLYIASRVAEAHGGRIWCEPREGGGSAFRVLLPA